MRIYEQRIVRFGPRAGEAGTQHITDNAARVLTAGGGHLFGVFRPVIGLSTNLAIVITEWPDEEAADAHGHLVLDGVGGATTQSRDLWEPTSRPLAGASPTEAGGYYSHRAFDILEADWPHFLELSETAWDNFEGAHASRVAGFWKSRRAPAAGQLRIRLMAWYENLDAWDRSRWWNPAARQGSDRSFTRFRERAQLLQDTSVAILTRVPRPNETTR